MSDIPTANDGRILCHWPRSAPAGAAPKRQQKVMPPFGRDPTLPRPLWVSNDPTKGFAKVRREGNQRDRQDPASGDTTETSLATAQDSRETSESFLLSKSSSQHTATFIPYIRALWSARNRFCVEVDRREESLQKPNSSVKHSRNKHTTSQRK